MKKYSLIFSVITALVLLFALFGCGARKVEKNRVEESTKTEIADKSKTDKLEITETKTETNIKKSEEITINNQDQSTTVEETIEPLDPNKEAAYIDVSGKKQILNNAKKTTKTTTKNNNTKTESSTKTDASEKLASKTDKKVFDFKDIKVVGIAKKKTEDIHIKRDAVSLWNWLWFLIPIGVCYWAWKNKTTIAAKLSGWWV